MAHPNSLANLKPPWRPGGPSPNPGGKHKAHAIVDEMRRLLDADPKLATAIAKRILLQMTKDPGFLKEGLLRLYGHVPKDEQKQQPALRVIVQEMNVLSVMKDTPQGTGIAPSTASAPIAPATSNGEAVHTNGHAAPQVEEVEAVPVDEDDLEEMLEDDEEDEDE